MDPLGYVYFSLYLGKPAKFDEYVADEWFWITTSNILPKNGIEKNNIE